VLLIFILCNYDRRSLIYKFERRRLTNGGLEMFQKEVVMVGKLEVLSLEFFLEGLRIITKNLILLFSLTVHLTIILANDNPDAQIC
jgi:hypothetical protein